MFKHSPLNLTKPSVRLLKLLKQDPDDQIRLSLRHASLEDGTPYSALSYEWGSPKDLTFEIVLNNEIFKVRKNLFDCLSCLSKQVVGSESFELWIDAICIDQDHMKERNHQVQQMRQIYEGAERVVIWLGPAYSNSEQLFECLGAFPTVRRTESTATFLKTLSKEQWRACHDIFLVAGFETWRATAALANRSY